MTLEGEKVRPEARGDRKVAGEREQVSGSAEPMAALAAWAMGYGSMSQANCKWWVLWTLENGGRREENRRSKVKS